MTKYDIFFHPLLYMVHHIHMLAFICLFDNLNKMEEGDGMVRKDIAPGFLLAPGMHG